MARRTIVIAGVITITCVICLWLTDNGRASLNDVERVQAGMSASEVQTILGKSNERLGLGDAEAPGYSIIYDLVDGNASIEYTPTDNVRRVRWQVPHGRVHQWYNRLYDTFH